jgi:predicted dehydrogenase
MGSHRVRVGLLGATHWHLPLYLPTLASQARVVAVWDPDSTAADALARRTGAAACGSAEEVVEGHRPELVLVTTSHGRMAGDALLAVQRGVAVVVEKPCGLAAAEVTQLAEASAAFGAPVATAYVQRVGPLFDQLRRVGEPQSLAFAFHAGPPSRYAGANAWMLESATAGGGCFLNLGSHFVDAALHLAGPAGALRGAVQRQCGHGVEDHAVCVIEHAAAVSVITTSYGFPTSPMARTFTFEASGLDGFLTVARTGETRFVDRATGAVEESRSDYDSDPLYGRLTRRALATHRDGFAGLPTLEQAAATLATIEEFYASLSTGPGRP